MLIAEPMPSTSVAVDANISGAVSKYDISPSFPTNRDPSGQTGLTRNRGY